MAMRKLSGIWDFIGRHKYFFVLAIIALVVGVVDENSLMHRHERQRVIDGLEREIEQYRDKYYKDTRALKGLDDAATLEKFAREKYLMHRENEDLFVLDDKQY